MLVRERSKRRFDDVKVERSICLEEVAESER